MRGLTLNRPPYLDFITLSDELQPPAPRHFHTDSYAFQRKPERHLWLTERQSFAARVLLDGIGGRTMRTLSIAFGLAGLLVATSAFAQYPPPQSPEDQRCRQVAQSRIFSEPNPEGLGLVDHGYRIWAKCMRQAGASVPAKRHINARS